MGKNHRSDKVADRIKVVVAQLLETKIKDPRLGFVTITDARVTGDLQHASIFYTVFGTPEEREATAEALEVARGQIRTEIGRRLGIKHTPSVKFIVDAIPEASAHLEGLLREMHAADAALAEIKAGAEFAGEADPYKHDDEDDADEEEAK